MIRNFLLGAGVLATLLSVLIFSGRLPIGNTATKPKGDVVMWGTLPDSQVNAVIQPFNAKAETYAVRYTYVPEERFEQKLLEALASGTGPDMIFTPYQIILSQSARIYPFPVSNLSEKAYKDTFVDGASVLFTPYGALAFPISVEPLVLFYNRAMLSKHGIPNPPQYWNDIAAMTPVLTVRDKGQFLESAVALGSPTVPHTKDIIMAIVAQLGQTPVVSYYTESGTQQFSIQINEPAVKDSAIYPLSTVSRYVTQFADPAQATFTWNDSLGSADDRFVAEKLAMYIGYSGEYNTLKSRNPRGEFEMTYFPQTKGYNTFVTGMRMYGIATLRSTRNMTTALTVQAEFSGGGIAPSLARIIGALPALRSYASTPELDPVLSRSMLVARGWWDNHYKESSSYIGVMLSDIINYRYGVSDASNMLVSRLKDLYYQTH
ncbi:MAG: hypothetical protein RLZZ308_632 [Candidatus Parcubacteria bacterium]|jgi:ABC-type glycerol-3-phosphate transport system substrate-binding protein